MNQVQPAPVQTGYDQRPAHPVGLFSYLWINWFQTLAAAVNSLIDLQMSGTLAKLPNLSAAQAGTLYFVTDYAHNLEWTGSAWQWAAGENGSGYIVTVPSGVTLGTGWHACDGSSQKMLLSTGTTQSVMLPNTSGAYFRQ